MGNRTSRASKSRSSNTKPAASGATSNRERQQAYRRRVRESGNRRLQLYVTAEVAARATELADSLRCNKTELISRLVDEAWQKQDVAKPPRKAAGRGARAEWSELSTRPQNASAAPALPALRQVVTRPGPEKGIYHICHGSQPLGCVGRNTAGDWRAVLFRDEATVATGGTRRAAVAALWKAAESKAGGRN